MTFRSAHFLGTAVAGFLLATSAFASTTYVYETPANSTAGGQSVGAEASFTLNQGNLNVTLWNTEPTINDAGQVLGDEIFSLSNSLAAPTISGSGTEVNIADNGSYSSTSISDVGWGLGTTQSGSDIICDICPGNVNFSTNPSVTPKETIIPWESSYASANGSIDGNKGHNPFLAGPVTFTITDSSITPLTTISNVAFSFSTTGGVEVDAVNVTPEPMTFAMTGLGLALTLAGTLRRRKAAVSQA